MSPKHARDAAARVLRRVAVSFHHDDNSIFRYRITSRAGFSAERRWRASKIKINLCPRIYNAGDLGRGLRSYSRTRMKKSARTKMMPRGHWLAYNFKSKRHISISDRTTLHDLSYEFNNRIVCNNDWIYDCHLSLRSTRISHKRNFLLELPKWSVFVDNYRYRIYELTFKINALLHCHVMRVKINGDN